MDRPGLLILASGLGERFGGGDKLMADLHGKPVLEYVLDTCQHTEIEHQWIAIGDEQAARIELARSYPIEILKNTAPKLGQSQSIKLGVRAAMKANVSSLIITLADTPAVGAEHLLSLQARLTVDLEAVMSEVDGRLQPPAVFAKDVLPELKQLTGDTGARKLFQELERTDTVSLRKHKAFDIDTIEDLNHFKSGAYLD
ncbi:MAG: nucleotidyltransferase family protein [Pseudomonadota bacterium]